MKPHEYDSMSTDELKVILNDDFRNNINLKTDELMYITELLSNREEILPDTNKTFNNFNEHYRPFKDNEPLYSLEGKKHKSIFRTSLIAASLVIVLLIGTATVAATNPNFIVTIENAFKKEETASKLKGRIITLELCSDNDFTAICDEYLITNTTEIHVNAENLSKTDEVKIYLFSNESDTIPIMETSLSKAKQSVDFTNLSSLYGYKVKAVAEKCEQRIVIRITE